MNMGQHRADECRHTKIPSTAHSITRQGDNSCTGLQQSRVAGSQKRLGDASSQCVASWQQVAIETASKACSYLHHIPDVKYWLSQGNKDVSVPKHGLITCVRARENKKHPGQCHICVSPFLVALLHVQARGLASDPASVRGFLSAPWRPLQDTNPHFLNSLWEPPLASLSIIEYQERCKCFTRFSSTVCQIWPK